MSRTRAARILLPLSLVFLGACAGGEEPSASSPSPSLSPPTIDEMKAAFLTATEVGTEYQGGTPSEKTTGITEAEKPVCDIEVKKADQKLVATYIHKNGIRSVLERIESFATPADAATYIEDRRKQGEARCEYDESAGKVQYHVKVDGPLQDLPPSGDASAGYSQSYTGEYKGLRYTMTAQIGLTTVYMEVTAPDLDGKFAVEVFRKAVEKAKITLA